MNIKYDISVGYLFFDNKTREENTELFYNVPFLCNFLLFFIEIKMITIYLLFTIVRSALLYFVWLVYEVIVRVIVCGTDRVGTEAADASRVNDAATPLPLGASLFVMSRANTLHNLIRKLHCPF